MEKSVYVSKLLFFEYARMHEILQENIGITIDYEFLMNASLRLQRGLGKENSGCVSGM